MTSDDERPTVLRAESHTGRATAAATDRASDWMAGNTTAICSITAPGAWSSRCSTNWSGSTGGDRPRRELAFTEADERKAEYLRGGGTLIAVGKPHNRD